MIRTPLVITIILNTNRKEDTLAVLASLSGCDYSNKRTIILDNASMDGSVEAIHSSYPEVEVIGLRQNLGYAGNNNVGIQVAVNRGADWVLVLNEDTVVAPDCLTRLVEVGESNPRIGIVGPMVYHYDEPDVIQSAGGRMDRSWRTWHLAQNELDHGQFTTPHVVEWISGCAIMIRRAVIEQVGGLDERFFYYWEETEWCLRARKRGWMIMHIPEAKLWHKGVQRNYQPGSNVTYYSTRNRFLMLSKHRAPIMAWIVAWGQTLKTLVSWSIKPRWGAMRSHKLAMWQGARDFLSHRWGMRVSQ